MKQAASRTRQEDTQQATTDHQQRTTAKRVCKAQALTEANKNTCDSLKCKRPAHTPCTCPAQTRPRSPPRRKACTTSSESTPAARAQRALTPSIRLLRHERPLQPRRKAGAASSAQTRRLNLVNDAFRPKPQHVLGLVPVTLRATTNPCVNV